MAKILTSFEQLNEQMQSDDFDMGKDFVPEKEQKYVVVSKIAYLLGIGRRHFRCMF